ncbi:unnamed protein product [Caenorhabditis angaria]|uniref:RNA-directed RNA polymerase n=1 Tax=Caenorhabditis angaria TaxID=860376 RepID=A0A9P1I4I3_9PELO|nr:unnamed protein product [Caenorhabditis angaria]
MKITAAVKWEKRKPKGVDEEKWKKEIEWQEKIIIGIFEKKYIVVKSEGILSGEEMEEKYYVETFELTSSSIDFSVIQNVESILRFFESRGIESGSFILTDDTLFNPKIMYFEKHYKLDAFGFCSLDRERVTFTYRNISRNFESTEIQFEFDKPNIVIARAIRPEQSTNHGRVFHNVVTYTLQVHRQTITRIIIDKKRIYFRLTAPVVIQKGKLSKKEQEKNRKPRFDRTLTIGDDTHKLLFSDSEWFYLAIDSFIQDDVFYNILSRFHFRVEVPIEFTRLKNKIDDDTPVNGTDYSYWNKNKEPTDMDDRFFSRFLKQVFVTHRVLQESGRNKGADIMRERRFTYVYLIECLLSRGTFVKNQLLNDINEWLYFLRIIEKHFKDDNNHNFCESALEDTINYIDSGKRVGSIIDLFENFCIQRKLSGKSNQLTPEQYDEGYRKVRKVVLTPTRIIPIVPEIIMGNRVLSNGDHDGTRIIRVTFRDDGNQPMRRIALGEQLLRETVKRYLSSGILVAGRRFGYLGSSNSQMRDNGAYFMEKCSARDERYFQENNLLIPDDFIPKIKKFRKSLGRFEDLESIPKVMARLGQCFTQARSCPGAQLSRNEYLVIFDVIGGKNSKREAYTFTDGIGVISQELASAVAGNMSFGKNCIPSAFQFRYRGLKGMVAIDPFLDEVAKHFRNLYRHGYFKPYSRIVPENVEMTQAEYDLEPWTYRACFRPSQIKFITTTKPCPIELVKYSSPCVVALNRPLINVMDHVSENQSRACHKRICERIEELLDDQLLSFLKYMNNEDSCRAKLQEMPRRVHFGSLKKMSGFMLSTEPFFRSLVRAAVAVMLSKLLRKTQIQIPPHLGRSMFGVTDETGRLQYGQVFVQYTANINDKTPSKTSKRIIQKGQVLLTKCPSVVSGDVRIFEAVDIPELHHLNDVVVFPQHGPRSNPDEMAGSDLDGDEYTVIWDEQLLLERNEPAFNFTSEKINQKFDIDNMDPLMHDFFIEYIIQDSVGAISLNHLYQSDQFGIESEVCDRLATKLTKALDYAKSGDPPAQLTTKWEKDPDDPEIVYAPERSERLPDFSANQDKSLAMYTSSRLIGKLFRELKSLDDVLNLSDGLDLDTIELDPMIEIYGWKKYESVARIEMEKYNWQLKSIMNNYGIKTEAEVFSGSILNMRTRISDKEQDDMSFYNTENVIETQMSTLFRTFREDFFREFANNPEAPEAFMTVTEPENWKWGRIENVLRRVCLAPSTEMKQKAVAYYKVCYQTCIDSSDKKMLSFGWIAYDVLNAVRTAEIVSNDDVELKPVGSNPLYSMIEKNRNEFLLSNPSVVIPTSAADKYLSHDLREVLLVLVNWAIGNKVFEQSRENSGRKFGLKEFPLIFVQFVMQFVIHGKTIIDENYNIENENDEEIITETEKNQLTLGFFQFLSSRKFRRQKYLSFYSVGVKSVYMRGEWLTLHKAAQKTYYKMLINLKMEDFPASASDRNSMNLSTKEINPFYIELPSKEDRLIIEKMLLNKSKCVEVHMRRISENLENTRYLISARGTPTSIQTLRQLCMKTYHPKYRNCVITNFVEKSGRISGKILIDLVKYICTCNY